MSEPRYDILDDEGKVLHRAVTKDMAAYYHRHYWNERGEWIERRRVKNEEPTDG